MSLEVLLVQFFASFKRERRDVELGGEGGSGRDLGGERSMFRICHMKIFFNKKDERTKTF